MDPSNHQNNPIETPFLLVDQRRDRFFVMHAIGNTSDGVVVRKAVLSADFDTWANFLNQHDQSTPIKDVFVAVKMVGITQDVILQALRVDVERSLKVPYHQNILGIRKPFHYSRYYSVVLPLMDLGSLRSIMTSRFPYGLPEVCIIVVLREILRGLSLIHSKGLIHGQINAGHVFFNAKSEIRLAFGASVYDDVQDSPESTSQYLPHNSICHWAAAPEVYHRDTFICERSDVWLIGITALELAYGGLKVFNRDDLESRLKTILTQKALPREWGDTTSEGGFKRFASSLFKKGKFSKSFENMVVNCFEFEAKWRPTVQELLEHEAFTQCQSDVFCLNNILRNK
ncbi:hypothetical protein BUALT_Bualt01G0218800 [Buddleja alternifolia]|uniref:Protein kinase domain-containing protein n=1 Tax=Buddleja alternifolia TaxID=168488 RepID=A0AAV6YAQ1_9LAMI|nr:hypothetical protein BUALT_Bualt01G0218800 [Buddleja alternifolia]